MKSYGAIICNNGTERSKLVPHSEFTPLARDGPAHPPALSSHTQSTSGVWQWAVGGVNSGISEPHRTKSDVPNPEWRREREPTGCSLVVVDASVFNVMHV